MTTQAYHITPLVMLTKQQQADADFVAHCSPSELSRGMVLAHLRHRYGTARIALNVETGAIVVQGLFTATPVDSKSPFATVGTRNPFL